MKTIQGKLSRYWSHFALLLATAALIAACGGGDEPTPTPEPTVAPPTATPEPAANTPEPTEPAAEAEAADTETPAADAQPESPLDQPASPLSQPESPLTGENVPGAAIPVPKTEEQAIALAAESNPPTPTAGNGSFSGVLWSFALQEVVPGVQFYLVEAEEVDGKLVPPAVYFGPKEGDLIGFADIAGKVQMDNVPPGNYYMLVWTVYNWLLPFPSAAEEGVPVMITVEEGSETNLGVLYLNWP